MSSRANATAPNAQAILRDIVLLDEPRSPARPPANRNGTARPGEKVLSPPVRPASPVQHPPASDEAHAKAYEAGYAAGLAAARQEAESRGYQEGLTRGQKSGERTVADQAAAQQRLLEAHTQAAARLLADLHESRSEQLVGVEDDMIAVCFEAICAILGEQAITADGVRRQVAQALHRCQTQEGVAVHLHPEDAERLSRQMPIPQWPASLRLVSDPDIQLGGCVLRSPAGGLDARLETQIAALRQVLLLGRQASHAARVVPERSMP